MYLVAGADRDRLLALDSGGHLRPGWPVEVDAGYRLGPIVVDHDGSVIAEACGDAASGCVIHRFGPAGSEASGWPVALPNDFACPDRRVCMPAEIFAARDGTVFVSHGHVAGGVQALAVDASGAILAGWPIGPERGTYWQQLEVGHDGTLYALSAPDGSTKPSMISAFGPDGSFRPGWPVVIPESPWTRFQPGPDGTVVVWSPIDLAGELCPEPRRTLFTVLGPDGRTLPGWPRGSTGLASEPVVGPDGTIYYVSATGRVYAHDRAGDVRAGWPVLVPGAAGGCEPRRPYRGPDGTIYVLGDEVVALSADGRRREGWPPRLPGSLTTDIETDTDGWPTPVGPAFGADGTVYLVVYQTDAGRVRAEIVAIDRQGRGKPGWPYALPIVPEPGATEPFGIGPLTLSADGRVIVRAGVASPVLLALDPDGRLAQ